jgi:hypothetical protein
LFVRVGLGRLKADVDKFAATLERMQLEEYLRYIADPRRLIRVNFVSGVARGVGSAVGFTILGAIVVVIFRHLVIENIPVIGAFLAEVVRVVNERL